MLDEHETRETHLLRASALESATSAQVSDGDGFRLRCHGLKPAVDYVVMEPTADNEKTSSHLKDFGYAVGLQLHRVSRVFLQKGGKSGSFYWCSEMVYGLEIDLHFVHPSLK
ncbi:hypothetical protein DM860_011780 [Cuscuta australis]|uniref:Uncharacterized protein n=1 Tax=Cuscuta australis TaxID=267555 RepID=A0A328DKB1_9ASTE|nr:hypothetical protein DM860_011780 [Cuscuta australis]